MVVLGVASTRADTAHPAMTSAQGGIAWRSSVSLALADRHTALSGDFARRPTLQSRGPLPVTGPWTMEHMAMTLGTAPEVASSQHTHAALWPLGASLLALAMFALLRR